MTNYTFVNYKNTKSLIPKEVWLTAEHLSETEPLFMTEHLVDNDGKLYRRYRLRTCDPTTLSKPSIMTSSVRTATISFASAEWPWMP